MNDRRKLNAAIRAVVGDASLGAEDCGTCAVATIGEGKTFAFYHTQDTERAFDDEGEGDNLIGSLYVGFGTPDGEDADRVGRIVQTAIELAGFLTEWDGTGGRRIAVVGKTVRFDS